MNQLGKTEALYQKDDSKLTAEVTVAAVIPFAELDDGLKPLFKDAPPDAHVVVTDRTIFYAQGGGQPADTGSMKLGGDSDDGLAFQVTGVRRAPSGPILHLGTFSGQSDSSSASAFKAGDKVFQAVDAATRELHSKIHDAGHIISMSIRQLSASIGDVSELKAQHYPGAAFVEFRGLIEGKHKADIEAAACDMVRSNLPITVRWWTPEELRQHCWAVPENLDLAEGELARAVEMEGAGAYACGGTHMRTTGEIGDIQIRKITRQKGISKVSYCLK